MRRYSDTPTIKLIGSAGETPAFLEATMNVSRWTTSIRHAKSSLDDVIVLQPRFARGARLGDK